MVKKAYIKRDFKSDKVFEVIWDDQLEEQVNCVIAMFDIINFVETLFNFNTKFFSLF